MNMYNAVDAAVSRAVNVGWSHHVLDIAMPRVSDIGTGVPIMVVCLVLLIFVKKGQRGRFYLEILAGLTLTYYVVQFLKEMFGRPRPYIDIPDLRVLVREKSFSFPSGHSTQAFMAATVISGVFRRFGAVCFVIAGLVAFSRVYIGVHYLSDVIAGAAVGSLIGLAIMAMGKSGAADCCTAKHKLP